MSCKYMSSMSICRFFIVNLWCNYEKQFCSSSVVKQLKNAIQKEKLLFCFLIIKYFQLQYQQIILSINFFSFIIALRLSFYYTQRYQ